MPLRLERIFWELGVLSLIPRQPSVLPQMPLRIFFLPSPEEKSAGGANDQSARSRQITGDASCSGSCSYGTFHIYEWPAWRQIREQGCSLSRCDADRIFL